MFRRGSKPAGRRGSFHAGARPMNPLHVKILTALQKHGPVDRYGVEQVIPQDPARFRVGGWAKYHLRNLEVAGYVERRPRQCGDVYWSELWAITEAGLAALGSASIFDAIWVAAKPDEEMKN